MASAHEHGVKRLSGNVLDMKFMKRTKLRIEDDVRKAEERKKQVEFLKLSDPSTSEDQCKAIKYEHRIEVLENLVFGRMSFQGFNTDVERYMKHHERVRNGEVEDADDSKDVNDEDLAAQ
uniref:NAM-associated domain-containing protein n=1 Tax=Steinernema glaseri TaxID=37863 RepID=A0A1I8AB66_9BILA